MNFTTEVEEGFMGVKIPVMKFDDGNVKFWIPRWEWERVLDALHRSIAEHPID